MSALTVPGPLAAAAVLFASVAVRRAVPARGMDGTRSRPGRASRRAGRRRSRAIAGEVADLIDQFRLAASAGLPVVSSLDVLAPHAPPALAPAVQRAARVRSRGVPLDVVLRELAEELGEPAAELIALLRHAAATGAPARLPLEALARRTRDARRHEARAAARRLPVTMLFPLVCCVLPAGLLLAVAPVVAVAVRSLGT